MIKTGRGEARAGGSARAQQHTKRARHRGLGLGCSPGAGTTSVPGTSRSLDPTGAEGGARGREMGQVHPPRAAPAPAPGGNSRGPPGGGASQPADEQGEGASSWAPPARDLLTGTGARARTRPDTLRSGRGCRRSPPRRPRTPGGRLATCPTGHASEKAGSSRRLGPQRRLRAPHALSFLPRPSLALSHERFLRSP